MLFQFRQPFLIEAELPRRKQRRITEFNLKRINRRARGHNIDKRFENPGTDAATQGLFYLGSANYQANNKDDAEKNFREFLDENSDDALLVASAYAGIAAVREDNEDFTEAANFYKEAADRSQSQFQVEMYIISAVRNFHKSGRSEIALELITNMLDDDEVSSETKNSAEYLKSLISTEKG